MGSKGLHSSRRISADEPPSLRYGRAGIDRTYTVRGNARAGGQQLPQHCRLLRAAIRRSASCARFEMSDKLHREDWFSGFVWLPDLLPHHLPFRLHCDSIGTFDAHVTGERVPDPERGAIVKCCVWRFRRRRRCLLVPSGRRLGLSRGIPRPGSRPSGSLTRSAGASVSVRSESA